MSATCQQAAEGAGMGIASALRAVDCVAGNVTGDAFGRLFAPGGSMATVLTILLTLYVAFFALQLLTGRSSLGVRSLTPRMITVGLVLTFATSWVAYSSVVWNLAIGAPDWLASVLTGDHGSATITFAQKIDIVFQAIQEATKNTKNVTAFSPEGMMWLGAMLFLLGTVGILVTSRIALAVLVALGPVFVVMALFSSTRGLFAGWVKGVTLLALAPLFAVLGGSVMLELAVPILAALVGAGGGNLDPQAAMGFFMIGAVDLALMALVLKVASTMVSGWTVFGLAGGSREQASEVRQVPAVAALLPPPPHMAQAQGTNESLAAARRIDISGHQVAVAANDLSGNGAASGRMVAASTATSSSSQPEPAVSMPSRAVGVGSRFRPATTRSREKLK